MTYMQISTVLLLWIPAIMEGVVGFNVAYGKPAIQSYVGRNRTANLAVDGNPDPNFWNGSCIQTEYGEVDQWWMVDLQAVYNISDVWIQNRGDTYGVKLHDFTVEVFLEHPVGCGEKTKTLCNIHPGPAADGEYIHMPCREEAIGRYVKILKLPEYITNPSTDILIICEVSVEGTIVHACSRAGKFTKNEGKMMPSNNNITLGVPTIECSRMCYSDDSCYGINIRPIDDGCQLVADLDISPALFTMDQSWDVFVLC